MINTLVHSSTFEIKNYHFLERFYFIKEIKHELYTKILV